MSTEPGREMAGVGWEELSPSSRRAFQFAAASSQADSRSFTSSKDLLAGLMWAHGRTGEATQLVTHFGVLADVVASLQRQGVRSPTETTDEPPTLDGYPPVEPDIEQIIGVALKLGLNSAESDDRYRVHLRHVFGGLLQIDGPGRTILDTSLRSVSAPADEIYARYSDYLRSDSNFAQYLVDAYGVERVPFRRPAYASDSIGTEDFLGIGPEVQALSYLIAAKEVSPPLAIGLFGDWGSGKTHFMNALRRQIDILSTEARDSRRPQADLSIYKSIIQVEFNAWHYVEGDLWASLVEHIFANLKRRWDEPLDAVEIRQRAIIDQLDSARREAEKTDAEIREERAHLDRLEQDAKLAEDDLRQRERELDDVSTADALDGVVMPDLLAEIQPSLDKLGITAASDAVGDLEDAVAETRDLARRGVSVSRLINAKPLGWTLAVIGAIAVGPLVTFALEAIDASAVSSATTALASVAAALAGVLRSASGRASQVLDEIEGAAKRLQAKKQEELADHRDKVRRARVAVGEAQDSLQALSRQSAASEERIAELERELKTITPGRVLREFIEERVGSTDYQQRLGVAAIIRRDFTRLSKLIDRQNEELRAASAEQPEDNPAIINRIVLYIDDLDRCPPEKVVDVLQAVHLLLAFPIFTVVVAVDARWLAQSLRAHYKELLAGGRQGALSDSSAAASPEDYLEKIFQIPFWLRPISGHASLTMLGGVLNARLERAPLPLAKGPATRGGPQEESDTLRYDAIEIDLNPEAVQVGDAELAFMSEVADLAGDTPRELKRFVNLYMLVKSLALRSGSDFLAETELPEYQRAMLLLAIVTGMPPISGMLFDQIDNGVLATRSSEREEASPSTFGELLDRFADQLDGGQRRLAERLKAWAAAHGTRWLDAPVDGFADLTGTIAAFSYRIRPSRAPAA